MSTNMEDLRYALNYAQAQFRSWRTQELLTAAELETMQADYLSRLEALQNQTDPENFLEEPRPCSEEFRKTELLLRVHRFLKREVTRHQQEFRLSETSAQKIAAAIARQVEALQQKLVAQPVSRSAPEPQVRASLLERLLNPRNLQILMGSGGGLLVIGLVAWLWSIGVFENRLIVASCLGGANLALIGLGVAAVKFSRYQLAGTGVTLLGALLLPLNLWFYDSQGLITLNQGGHLWIPALCCCVIYAGIARVLKNPLFVHTLVGGVALTGLLLLADHQVGRFWEVISPSALLVVLGVICVHVERLFVAGKENFSRETFGRAFFQAGHVSLSLGLLVLFGGFLASWCYEPVFASYQWFSIPDLAVKQSVQGTALLLTLLSTYTYLYSLTVTNQKRGFLVSAIFTLLWSEFILLNLLDIEITVPVLSILTIVTACQAYLVAWGVSFRKDSTRVDSAAVAVRPVWLNAILNAALGLLVLALGLQISQILRAYHSPVAFWWSTEVDVTLFVSLLLGTVAWSWGAWLESWNRRDGFSLLAVRGGVLSGVLTLVTGMQLLQVPFLEGLAVQAGLLLVLLFAGSRWTATKPRLDGLTTVLEWGGMSLLGLQILQHLGLWNWPFAGMSEDGMRSLLSLELSVLFAVMAIRFPAPRFFYLAVFCLWSAVWQLLVTSGWITYSGMLSASVMGLILLVLSRLSATKLATWKSQLTFSGMLAICLGGTAGILLSGNRLIGGEAEWTLLGLMAAQLLLTLIASSLTVSEEQRNGLILLATGHLLSGFVLINDLSSLSLWQQVELFSLLGGVLLLLAGHVGWWNEGDEPQGLVSLQLIGGCLFLSIPLLCGLMEQRIWGVSASWGWVMLHEVGVLAVGLILLGTGLVCQIRCTTLVGTALLVAYVGSLVTLLHLPKQMQHVAVYLMVGGALFFGTAVLLSIYRDHLLAIPQRIRSGEGVFRVLKWR